MPFGPSTAKVTPEATKTAMASALAITRFGAGQRTRRSRSRRRSSVKSTACAPRASQAERVNVTTMNDTISAVPATYWISSFERGRCRRSVGPSGAVITTNAAATFLCTNVAAGGSACGSSVSPKACWRRPSSERSTPGTNRARSTRRASDSSRRAAAESQNTAAQAAACIQTSRPS